MKIDKLSNKWIFKTHSRQQISEWAKHLKYFYFVRAWGGFGYEGDMFKASIGFSDKADLVYKLSKLNIQLNMIPPDYPRPIPGKSYTNEEYKIFKEAITDYQDLEQPSNQKLNEANCHVWVDRRSITFSVSGANGDIYSVSQGDFDACKKIESLFDLANFQNQKDLKIEENICCISRKIYPELFS